MKHAGGQERKVQEVKAILEGLQRYATGETVTPAASEDAAPTVSRPPVAILVAVIAAVAVLILGGIYALSPRNKNVPATLAVVPKVSPGAAQKRTDPTLDAAMTLLSSGRVRSAREQLTVLARQESADAAWALARSYDPNYLRSLGGADASPDVTEATRWYRAWFEVAVKQGAVADSVSLERIIRSME